MAVLAVLIPVLMLGMLLMMGRYEDLVLPREAEPPRPEPEPDAATAALKP
ncbi:hypothetical protein ACIRPP_25880 [Streptomyces sp. NPDC101219]